MAKKAMKRPNGAGTVIDYGPRARLRLICTPRGSMFRRQI